MFKLIKKIFEKYEIKEKRWFFLFLVIFIISGFLKTIMAINEKTITLPVDDGVYREGIVGQITFLNPLISYNPIDQDLSRLIYSPLGDLIENLEAQNNYQNFIIVLKEDLKWSDDQPLTSEDVIFTFNLVQDSSVNSPYNYSFQGIKVEKISQIKAKISLPAPYVFFEEQIRELPIIPAHIFQNIPPLNLRLSEYNLKPVSSGPYVFESFSKDQQGFITEYRLKINNQYHLKKPHIKKIIFRFYKDDNELLEAFRLKKIDGFGTLKPIINENNPLFKNAIIKKINIPRIYALFFNLQMNPLLKEKTLREALFEAIDYEKLIKEVFNNQAYKPKIIAINFNKEAAQEKIKKLNLKENDSLSLIVPDSEFLKKTAFFLQQNWSEIGLKNIKIMEMDSEKILEEIIKQRKYEILLFGQILENPKDLFSFWHSSQRFNPGLNISGYENKEVDKLLEEIRQETNQEKIEEKLSLVYKHLQNDLPVIFLYELPYFYVHYKKLRGFEIDFIKKTSDRFKTIDSWYVKAAKILK